VVEEKKVTETYQHGLDIMGGVSFADVAPWLDVAGKGVGVFSSGVAAGATGGALSGARGRSTEEQVKKALEEQRARDRAEAQARTTRLVVYGALGIVGLSAGIVAWKALKKK
jgi:hypothetical protein